MIEFISHSTQQTEQFAKSFAKQLRAGDVIACRGGLGVGKTAFARGLAAGLGLSDDVSSPTFSLVHEYTQGPLALFHFDMYRIGSIEELYSTGYFDYLERGGVLMIEWSEQIENALEDGTILLTISRIDDQTRKITIEGERF